MGKVKNKMYDWKDRLRSGKMLTLVVTLIVIIVALLIYAYRREQDYRRLAENGYNNAFYQLIEYINNAEKLLAKATISYSSENATKTLTNISKETVLAQSYLARLPIEVQELENTQKFLNQLSDYCYSVSSKTIKGEKLSDEDLKNLTSLHEYSVNLENTLNQLEADMSASTIKWRELEQDASKVLSREGDNLSQSSFSNIEEDMHQYTGLIYDGAFSEGLDSTEKVGLTGDEINKEKAEEIAKNFIGNDIISDIKFTEESQNANIECYGYNVKTNSGTEYSICVSKKGGHIVSMNGNREIGEEKISPEDAVNMRKRISAKKRI